MSVPKIPKIICTFFSPPFLPQIQPNETLSVATFSKNYFRCSLGLPYLRLNSSSINVSLLLLSAWIYRPIHGVVQCVANSNDSTAHFYGESTGVWIVYCVDRVCIQSIDVWTTKSMCMGDCPVFVKIQRRCYGGRLKLLFRA